MERIVIIPALNPDEGLRDLVERNWELENQVILVDDGSDENAQRFSGNSVRNALFCIIKKIGERERRQRQL